MRRMGQVLASSVLMILGCASANAPPEDHKPLPLKKIADVPLPGPAVRFDYQSLDPSHGRLYIAHMNADQLVVFDVKKRDVVANLDGFANVHGVFGPFRNWTESMRRSRESIKSRLLTCRV